MSSLHRQLIAQLLLLLALLFLGRPVDAMGSCKEAGLCCTGRDASCVVQKTPQNAIIEDLRDTPCYCDHACLKLNDCCPDYRQTCGGNRRFCFSFAAELRATRQVNKGTAKNLFLGRFLISKDMEEKAGRVQFPNSSVSFHSFRTLPKDQRGRKRSCLVFKWEENWFLSYFFVSLSFLSVAAERYALLLLLLSLLSPFLFTKRESTVYITIRALFHIHKSPDVFISVGRTHSTPLRLVDFNCFFFFFFFSFFCLCPLGSTISYVGISWAQYRWRSIRVDHPTRTQMGFCCLCNYLPRVARMPRRIRASLPFWETKGGNKVKTGGGPLKYTPHRDKISSSFSSFLLLFFFPILAHNSPLVQGDDVRTVGNR